MFYILKLDQPSFALPRAMYVNPESFAVYVAAYKEYIVDVARVISREEGNGISDETLIQAAEDIFTLEAKLAEVRKAGKIFCAVMMNSLSILNILY